MKKVFGQTVRDLKREVNKKVLKVPGIEQKILDATSNEPWGPHGSHLGDLAQASRNHHEYQLIMAVIWKRINDTGKNWRHVYKALTVLEYLVAHGSERVIDEIREHAYQISTLADFQYIDSGGRDQGSNVRRKSQSLVALVNDKERIQEVRQKAQANKDKYSGRSSTGGAYRHSSYSGTGGYVDRCDDDRFEGRYGNRDDERNGYGKERDLGYRDDDRYGRGRDSFSRDGDQHGRDSEEQYGRDGYRGRGNDNYQFRSRSRSVDRYTDRSFDDDDRYSSRSGGDKADDHSQDERRLEGKLSEHNADAPPSYEEATRDAQNTIQDERDGETVAAPIQKVSSPPVPKPTSPSKSTGQGPDNAVAGESVIAPNNEVDAFDGFDPRGSVSAAPPAASSPELDIFGLSTSDSTNPLALVQATSATTTSKADMPTNSDFGMNFATPSLASTASNQPTEDPFGDSPFKAIPQRSIPAQHQNFPPVPSFQPSGSVDGSETLPSAARKVETFPSFDFGDALGGLTYAPTAVDGQHSSPSPPFLALELPMEQTSSDILDSILPRTGSAPLFSSQEAQPAAQTNMQAAQMNFLPPSGLSAPVASQGSPTITQTAQMNPFQPSGLSAPVASQGSPTNTQTAQMNPFQPSGLSAPVASQGSPTNTQTAQMNVFSPSGLSAPAASQGSPTNMHTTQMNFLQPSGPSVPAASQGSPTNMQTSQMNFFQPSGLSVPAASQGSETNKQTAQMNFLQPSGLSAAAASQGSQTNMQTAQMNFLQPSALSAPAASQGSQTNMQTAQMDFLQPSGLSAPLAPQAAQAAVQTNMQAAQSGAPANMQSAHLNLGSQSMLSDPFASQAALAAAGPPANSQSLKEKFEPKSTVWADTLSRGLVNLNISGPKINPLADIGVDFDAINRKEKRLEVKSSAAPVTSTITMGKAMGSGSGIGRAAASGLAPLPNPMMGSGMGMGGMGMGMGMVGGAGMGMGGAGMGLGGGAGMGVGAGMGMGMGGYGGNMNQTPMGMNMGMNMGMGMGMGMNMGMGQGAHVQPPTGMPPPGPGMPGAGYNPMMGMGGYGSQQPYGGGYR